MKKAGNSLVKILALFVLMLGVCPSMAAWDGKSMEKPDTATIDKKLYYLIKNEANLAWFSNYTNAPDGKVDINAKVVAEYLDMGHKSFIPIAAGLGQRVYKGTFDGNNVVIRNLYINSNELSAIDSTYGQNVGFIGSFQGTVKNLVLENVDILATADVGSIIKDSTQKVSAGAVVAWMKTGTVENCFTSGIIYNSGKGQAVGGVVGNAWAGTIKNCLSLVSINIAGTGAFVGGVVGQTREKEGTVLLSSCVYDGGSIVNDPVANDGGVIGNREDNSTNASNNFYNTTVVDKGVAKGDKDGVYGMANVNQSEIVCRLNEGTWDGSSCDKSGLWTNSDHITSNGFSHDDGENLVLMVTFDANGGQFPEGAKKVKMLKFGEVLTGSEIANPVMADESKFFWGWALTDTASKPATNLGKVYSAKTVYAVWKNAEDVVFDYNHEVTPRTVTKKFAVGDSVVAAMAPAAYTEDENTYYFAGWALTDDATAPLVNLGVAEAGKIYYAVWTTDPTYSVSFNMNGHGKELESQQIKASKKAVEPKPVVNGYTFEGWYKEKACKNKFNFATPINEDITLYAKWEKDTYTITYNLNGGENVKDNPSSYDVDSKTIVLKAPKSRKNYTFDGWYYDAEFTEPASQITTGSSGNISLYAKWTLLKYDVAYAAGLYGLGAVTGDIKYHGKTLILSSYTFTYHNFEAKDSAEKYVYYSQDGWALSDTGKVAYKLGGEYKKDSSVVLYPHWVKGLVVVYNENGDTIVVPVDIRDAEKEILKKIENAIENHNPAIPTPTKTPDDSVYTFTGWKKNETTGWYEPAFKGENRVKVITVKYGDGDGDTLQVKIYKDDYQEDINAKVNSALESKGIALPVRGLADDSLYVLNWVLDPETGYYVYSFNRFFAIDFNLPKKGRLSRKITGYSAGLVTILPTAYIDGDTTWEFKGWYEKPKGLGERYKAILADEYGDKSIYPLFQKTIRYEIDGKKGEVVIPYSENPERDIARALEGVTRILAQKGKLQFGVAVSDRTLEISGAKVGATVRVFDMNGKIVSQGVIENGTQRVELSKSGNYVVQVNRQSVRVNVK